MVVMHMQVGNTHMSWDKTFMFNELVVEYYKIHNFTCMHRWM